VRRGGFTRRVRLDGFAGEQRALVEASQTDAFPSVSELWIVPAERHGEYAEEDHYTAEAIVEALVDVPGPVVFPVHPRTEAALREYGLWERAEAELMMTEPVGYLDFVRLLAGADRVATDSGGVQKEAFYLDRPCVTLREETEWVELVQCGWNRLVGSDTRAIRAALTDPIDLPEKPPLYGDGDAAGNVVAALDRTEPAGTDRPGQ